MRTHHFIIYIYFIIFSRPAFNVQYMSCVCRYIYIFYVSSKEFKAFRFISTERTCFSVRCIETRQSLRYRLNDLLTNQRERTGKQSNLASRQDIKRNHGWSKQAHVLSQCRRHRNVDPSHSFFLLQECSRRMDYWCLVRCATTSLSARSRRRSTDDSTRRVIHPPIRRTSGALTSSGQGN